MDTDLMYIAISGEFDEIIRLKLQSQYNNGRKAEFLFISKNHNRTPGLFKAEFSGNKMIALTSTCYHARDEKGKPRFSCKSIRKNKLQCFGLDI